MGLFDNVFGPPNIDKLEAKGDLKGVLKAVASPDQSIRVAAMNAAMRFAVKDLDVIETVVGVTHGLAQDGGREALAVLIRAVGREYGNSDPLARRAAASLEQIGSPAVGPLLEMLGHPHSYVRETAIGILGRIGDTRALRPILRIAMQAEPGQMRSACGFACANLHTAHPAECQAIVAECSDQEREFMSAMTGFADAYRVWKKGQEPAGD